LLQREKTKIIFPFSLAARIFFLRSIHAENNENERRHSSAGQPEKLVSVLHRSFEIFICDKVVALRITETRDICFLKGTRLIFRCGDFFNLYRISRDRDRVTCIGIDYQKSMEAVTRSCLKHLVKYLIKLRDADPGR